MGMTAVASICGCCIFIGHDYVLNTIRVDKDNITTLISIVTAASWLVTGCWLASLVNLGNGTVRSRPFGEGRTQLIDGIVPQELACLLQAILEHL